MAEEYTCDEMMEPGAEMGELVGAFNGGLQATYVSMMALGRFRLVLGWSVQG